MGAGGHGGGRIRAEGGGVSGHYAGRRAALATMHGKEAAIAPPLFERLGLAVEVPPGLDTDRLGTFTGEVPRPGTIEETATRKARMAIEASGLRLGIASEGAYGPHPLVPFLAQGLELMVLVDDARGLVIREHLVEERPAYDQMIVSEADDPGDFLARIGFPEQAVIVRPETPGPRDVAAKGLRTRADVARAVAETAARASDGRVLVQTDMRAHMNARRMATLARLADRFAARIATPCPDCAAPGFGLIRTEKGLPCAWCGGPSMLVKAQVLGCVACGREERRPRPDGLMEADPGQCPVCNP